jgi:hypothetical protein
MASTGRFTAGSTGGVVAKTVSSGITIATGITAGVLGSTPSTPLPAVPRVLVPIQLDVLVVRTTGGKWAACALDAQGAPPPPFTELSRPRPAGAYLLWSLPSALTRLTQQPPDDPAIAAGQLPGTSGYPIPDRWLVVRMFAGQNQTRAVTAWVLQAGSATPVVTPLDSWTEPGNSTPDSQVTIMELGDVSATAYFDAVENQLAFYDPLTDATGTAPVSGPVSYLVCGWYSSSAADPLAAGGTLQSFQDTLTGFNWSLSPADLQALTDDAEANANALADLRSQQANTYIAAQPGTSQTLSPGLAWTPLTLLHGAAVCLGWPDIGIPSYPQGLLGDNSGGPPAASDVTVALGTTLADTVGCLIARQNNSADEAALIADEAALIEALQLGAMAILDAPDGLAQVDALLHATAFQTQPGEQTTDTVPPRINLPSWPPPATPAVAPATSTAQPGAQTAAETVTGTLQRPAGSGRLSDLPDTSAVAQAILAQPATVNLPGPLWYQPKDPVVVLQGAGRSYKHGADTRFSTDNTLACRLASDLVVSLSTPTPSGLNLTPDPYDMLQRTLNNGSLPAECDALLRETVLLDPGAATAAAASATVIANAGGAGLADDQAALAQLAEKFTVEQTVWWALRDPTADYTSLLQHLNIVGTLPVPLAITPPAPAWQPRHVEWQATYLPSAGGFTNWALGDVDYAPTGGPTGKPVGTLGRCLLTSGPAQTIAAAASRAIAMTTAAGSAQEITVQGPTLYSTQLQRILSTSLDTYSQHIESSQLIQLNSIAGALAQADMIGGSLQGLHDQIGATSPLRAGQMNFTRLRLVDAWGQFVDLMAADHPVAPSTIVVSPTLTGSTPATAQLAPRILCPAQLLLQYMQPDDSAQADTLNSAVCGYLLPDHLDSALQFFDANGGNLGSICCDQTAGLVWQAPPGSATSVGATISANADPHLIQIAQSLLEAGAADASGTNPPAEGILMAMLRLIDSTLWSTDPFGHTGDEHLSVLTGHPVVVLRGQLQLCIDVSSVSPDAQAVIAQTPIDVRLGSLTQWEDGLLGYYVNDNYQILHAVAQPAAGLARPFGPMRGFLGPAAQLGNVARDWAADVPATSTRTATGATPVEHPLICTTGDLAIHPTPVAHPPGNPASQTNVYPGQQLPLTLLVMPMTLVHATSGILPRNNVGMRREWITAALAHIAPTFRFGPVVLDPATTRIPVATDIESAWVWAHRLNSNTWQIDPVATSTQAAGLPDGRAVSQSGWLILNPAPQPPGAAGSQPPYYQVSRTPTSQVPGPIPGSAQPMA